MTYLMTSFLELLPGYKKSTLTFLSDDLVHESEEKLRAHFLHMGTPSVTGLKMDCITCGLLKSKKSK